MRINCLLDFYEKNIRHTFLMELPTNCGETNFKKLDGVQVNIYGEICGRSVGGKIQKSTSDEDCSTWRSNLQILCKPYLCKYSLPLFCFQN